MGGGYELHTSLGNGAGCGSLLLGAYDGFHKLHYVGSVGGGFSKRDLEITYSALTQLHTANSPFASEPKVDKFLFWCDPLLAIQVKYGEFTEKRNLRFPIFSALRPDIDPRDCTLAAISDS